MLLSVLSRSASWLIAPRGGPSASRSTPSPPPWSRGARRTPGGRWCREITSRTGRASRNSSNSSSSSSSNSSSSSSRGGGGGLLPDWRHNVASGVSGQKAFLPLVATLGRGSVFKSVNKKMYPKQLSEMVATLLFFNPDMGTLASTWHFCEQGLPDLPALASGVSGQQVSAQFTPPPIFCRLATLRRTKNL